jgi:hypothetical protein
MAETKRCQQCGRTGKRGFHTWPERDSAFEGRVVVPAHSMVECTGNAACRRRRRKPAGGSAGHAERMRAYE